MYLEQDIRIQLFLHPTPQETPQDSAHQSNEWNFVSLILEQLSIANTFVAGPSHEPMQLCLLETTFFHSQSYQSLPASQHYTTVPKKNNRHLGVKKGNPTRFISILPHLPEKCLVWLWYFDEYIHLAILLLLWILFKRSLSGLLVCLLGLLLPQSSSVKTP